MADAVTAAKPSVGTKEALQELAKEAHHRQETDARSVNRHLRPPEEKKPYILLQGTHSAPNPDYVPGDQATGGLSHILHQKGDVVMLTKDQYFAFRNKFRPHSSHAPIDPDAEVEVDPNAPAAPKVATST